MLEADEAYFKEHGEPLFSSHMLDFSEESKEHNIAACKKYLTRMTPMKIWLEMEIGITGGEEDGVDNTGVENSALYTQPEDIWDIYQELSVISPYFSIAAAFGNVHGVYKPGNVKLHPELLGKHQAYVKEKLNSPNDRPVFLVFHGGSGSTKDEISTAVHNGVVKMNIDTDTQYAYWEGILKFYKKNENRLQGVLDAQQNPNKKFYDPRVWLREAEISMKKRVEEAFQDLGGTNTL
jgi:fructose-bisphosphate aldolase class II